MTFVTAGLAIAGLVGMAIPIVIHLLARQRRRPVRWAAMKFLLEAYRKHRRRLQLEQLLLLAVRCLIVAVLGAALARPILQAAGVLDLGGSRQVFLVIDDGLASSALVDEQTTALDAHVEQARAIVETLAPGDFVGLITASSPPRTLIVPPSSDHGGVVEMLESLAPGESATDIPGALAALKTALEEQDEAKGSTLVYLLSEFRAGSASLDDALPAMLEELPDSVTLLALSPSQRPVGNTQIVAIDAVRNVLLPGAVDGSGQLSVRLRRTGGELGPQVTRVRLQGEGVSHVEPRTVRWDPGQAEAEVEFVLDLAAQGERQMAIEASIEGDAVEADNHRYAVLESREHIRVVLLDRRTFGFEPSIDRLTAGQWLRRALEPIDDGPIQVIEVEPVALDTPDLRRSDVAVIPRPDLLADRGWTLLREYVDAGGLVIITPPGGPRVHQWVEHLDGDLALPWRIGQEVVEPPSPMTLAGEQDGGSMLRLIASELPDLLSPIVVMRVLPVEDAGMSQVVLRLADGSPLLIAGSPVEQTPADGAGEAPAAATSGGLVVYLAAAPELGWTNLPSKPLMIPLVHELIRQGLSVVRSGWNERLGPLQASGLPPAARTLVDPEGERLDLAGPRRPSLSRSGHWRVLDQAGQELGLRAVNLDPDWGRTDVQSDAAVAAWLAESGSWSVLPGADLTGALGTAKAGSPVARTLLVLLLALVALETMLARWFSHALRSRATALPTGLSHAAQSNLSAGVLR